MWAENENFKFYVTESTVNIVTEKYSQSLRTLSTERLTMHCNHSLFSFTFYKRTESMEVGRVHHDPAYIHLPQTNVLIRFTLTMITVIITKLLRKRHHLSRWRRQLVVRSKRFSCTYVHLLNIVTLLVYESKVTAYSLQHQTKYYKWQ